MNQEERRKEILAWIRSSDAPVPGAALAKRCGVSRQVIVQDIAVLRAAGHNICSTYRGYLCQTAERVSRVYQVRHSDEEMEDELNTIVDNGGCVRDVFVEHEVYGRLYAKLNVNSRRKAAEFLEDIRSGKSSPLKNITSGMHFHTVEADGEETLDQIGRELEAKGYLIKEE